MTKKSSQKSSRLSMKEMIVNQANSTVNDLYAKRNALLAAEEESGQIEMTSQEDLTGPTFLISNNVSQGETLEENLPSEVINNILPVNPALPVNSASSPEILLSSQLDLTTPTVNSASPVNPNSPQDDQLEMTGQNELTMQVDNSALPVNLNGPLNDEFELTGKAELTSQLVNSNLPVNSNSSQNDQLQLTSQRKLTTETSEIARAVGLSGIGALALLHSLVGPNGAYVRTRNLARELGMSYQGFLNQLDRLVSAGFITSPPGDAAQGRWIQITRGDQLNLTGHFNLITKDSSSCSNDFKKTTTTTTEDLLSELALTSQIKLTSEELCENDPIKLTGQDKLTTVHPWEKIRLRDNAEDLFYIAMIAKVEIGKLSAQTLRLYEKIVKDRNRDYAVALFLVLLPKAKDNPTAYLSSAFNQGAEPTSASFVKVKEIQGTLEYLTKAPRSFSEIRQQIQEATEKDDTQTLLALVQKQAKIKEALQLLSWKGTLEAFVEKREEFITSLLL